MSVKIHTATARAALVPRRESYWVPLGGAGAGRFIGFRKMLPNKKGQTVETWMARARDRDTGKQRWTALGELTPTNDYDAACKAARDWFAELDEGVDTKAAFTVEDACREYVEELRRENRHETAADAEWRFERGAIYSPEPGEDEPTELTKLRLGQTEVTKLRAPTIKKWRQLLGMKNSGANRMMTTLRAALNLSVKNKRVSATAAQNWRDVEQYAKADGRREVFLDLPQRRALLEHAGTSLRDLLEGALMTGARPGELVKAKRSAFDARTKTLKLVGKTGPRDVSLVGATLALFERLAKSKLPEALLFTRDDGQPWTRIEWSRQIRAAAEAAVVKDDEGNDVKLPAGVCLYSCRHTYITQAITSGLTTLDVAKLTGTSLKMIEQNYGHLVQGAVRERLARVQML